MENPLHFVPSRFTFSTPYASTSHTMHPDEEPLTRFRTSSERDSPAPAPTGSPRYDPLGVLLDLPAPSSSRARAAFVVSDLPPERAPGILADGSLTARHPAVRAFLACPHPRADDPRLADPAIRALAALSVARRVAHPAHLLFWDGTREDKERTTLWLHDLLQQSPPLIRSPVAWLGVAEELWLVRHLQEIYTLSTEFAPRVLRKRARPSHAASATTTAAVAAPSALAAAEDAPSRMTTKRVRPPRAKKEAAAVAAVAAAVSQTSVRHRIPAPSMERVLSGVSSSSAPGSGESSPLSSPRSVLSDLPALSDLIPSSAPTTRARAGSTGSSTACSDTSDATTRVGDSPVLKRKVIGGGYDDDDDEEEEEEEGGVREGEDADARNALRAKSTRVRRPVHRADEAAEAEMRALGVDRAPPAKKRRVGSGAAAPARRVRAR